MPEERAVEQHYRHGQLIEVIRERLHALGRSPSAVSVDDLGPVDEFHIGGRQATGELAAQLELDSDDHVLDVGCGLGGTARFLSHNYGCRVTGIDLTQEYVEAAHALSDWVGLGERLAFHYGSALSLPFDDGVFDAATMLHVGMNIEGKRALCAEVARVLKPEAVFGVYDVMAMSGDELVYPVPWARAAELSALGSVEDYRNALRKAGFDIVGERNRRDFALEFFQTMRARMAEAGGPPPLGIHLLMGGEAPVRIANMITNIEAGRCAPVEMIARKTSVSPALGQT